MRSGAAAHLVACQTARSFCRAVVGLMNERTAWLPISPRGRDASRAICTFDTGWWRAMPKFRPPGQPWRQVLSAVLWLDVSNQTRVKTDQVVAVVAVVVVAFWRLLEHAYGAHLRDSAPKLLSKLVPAQPAVTNQLRTRPGRPSSAPAAVWLLISDRRGAPATGGIPRPDRGHPAPAMLPPSPAVSLSSKGLVVPTRHQRSIDTSSEASCYGICTPIFILYMPARPKANILPSRWGPGHPWRLCRAASTPQVPPADSRHDSERPPSGQSALASTMPSHHPLPNQQHLTPQMLAVTAPLRRPQHAKARERRSLRY